MDVGLGHLSQPLTASALRVLILVLVDVGLGPLEMWDYRSNRCRLNPCFSGCWSRTILCLRNGKYLDVLILVLVDVGLGLGRDITPPDANFCSLNPCFSGCWSRTTVSTPSCAPLSLS